MLSVVREPRTCSRDSLAVDANRVPRVGPLHRPIRRAEREGLTECAESQQ
jgi:hypothetical protein